ncbi:amidohydrolase family protein [Pseudalkalibacillus berkeleyi]|uniref:Amidohydrolase n=1 Tax=Pseudalkalibacillus berkeleyi TaxID=1069813 RepID=A0ABS9GXE1_9BACL|nr:amidohydrolase family protein [Pseudalkalibacillus berkeleyi]MCF6137442.1 amidohydrolase [Pseudalkalibacillus berkeleyi]
MKRFLFFIFIGFAVLIYIVTIKGSHIQIQSDLQYNPDSEMINKVNAMRESNDGNDPLYVIYNELPVIDIHNHDASLLDTTEKRTNEHARSLIEIWEKFGIDRTVLFGNVSEPSAVQTDKLSWKYYEEYPNLIYPSFAGIPLDEKQNGAKIVKEKLERGYMNMGEIYVASTFSNNTNLSWKGEHPYWGELPEIYEVTAEYKVPILLHIDPPRGKNITYLKKALMNHPDTIFIFAHGNVYNTPSNMKALLKQHDNVYFDFFPGFTAYHPKSKHSLLDFVPLIEAYPDRFFVGSDSGYEIGLEKSYLAIYELIDLLTPETAVKVAYQNYERFIEQQPPTSYQKMKIKELTTQLKLKTKSYRLNKRRANELIFKLTKEVGH